MLKFISRNNNNTTMNNMKTIIIHMPNVSKIMKNNITINKISHMAKRICFTTSLNNNITIIKGPSMVHLII